MNTPSLYLYIRAAHISTVTRRVSSPPGDLVMRSILVFVVFDPLLVVFCAYF